MREIKFRAWDNDKKILCSVTDINFSDYSANGVCFGDWSEFSINKLMQYTGLKDKNGIEIYEGDIVKSRLGIGFIDYTDSYFRIFRPFVFSSNLCNETDSNELESKNRVEVIGNIYENLELLS